MKQCIAFLLALTLAVSLCGCAETPEDDIIAQKDNDRLIEAATQSGDENRRSLEETQQSAPEHYTYSFTTEDGKVSITADAEVTLPEADTIPMYNLSCSGFTQEQATAIYDYLFDGDETWIMTGEDYSQEMADQDLIKAREAIASAQANPDLSEEARAQQIQNHQEVIDTIEEMYDSLPEVSQAQKEPNDSTYLTHEIQTMNGAEEYQGLEAHTDAGDLLLISNFAKGSDGSSQISYTSPTGSRYGLRDGITVTPEQADAQCKCSYSYDEAKALADGLLSAAGVEAKLVQTSLVKGVTETESNDGEEIQYDYDEDYSAYVFYYARIVDDTPVAVTTNQYIYHEDTNPIWLYESIEIAVDSNGISNIEWEFPVEVDEVIANDVEILPFEEAAAVFEQMTPLVYQGNAANLEEGTAMECSYTINVDRVELNLMRVRNSGGERTGLYVPAWVFYGTETQHCHYTDNDSDLDTTEATPWSILAVNAIDGTVIDVIAGY